MKREDPDAGLPTEALAKAGRRSTLYASTLNVLRNVLEFFAGIGYTCSNYGTSGACYAEGKNDNE